MYSTISSISIGYHDVIDPVRHGPSGPTNQHSDIYKIGRPEFQQQLRAIREAVGVEGVGIFDASQNSRLFLTFDDGGIGAYECIAPDLEGHRWLGHFFIVGSWIDRPGFVNVQQIREMHSRGHLIGTHSTSHPEFMSHLSWPELVWEWTDSIDRLSSILGKAVTVASVAGGFYSTKVARAAAVCGIKVLFTSEPTVARRVVEGCLVLGRYAVQAGMPPQQVAAIAAGDIIPRWRQNLTWNVRKAPKALLGKHYLRIRSFVLSRASENSRV